VVEAEGREDQGLRSRRAEEGAAAVPQVLLCNWSAARSRREAYINVRNAPLTTSLSVRSGFALGLFVGVVCFGKCWYAIT
jgi:hypothetical protein